MTSSASQSCFVVRGSDIGSASVDDRSACHHPECRVAVIGAGHSSIFLFEFGLTVVHGIEWTSNSLRAPPDMFVDRRRVVDAAHPHGAGCLWMATHTARGPLGNRSCIQSASAWAHRRRHGTHSCRGPRGFVHRFHCDQPREQISGYEGDRAKVPPSAFNGKPGSIEEAEAQSADCPSAVSAGAPAEHQHRPCATPTEVQS